MPSAFLLRANRHSLQRSKADLLACEGWELAGCAQTGNEALLRLPLVRPDVLLADRRTLDGRLLRLLADLEAQGTPVRVLMWTNRMDEPMLVEALVRGVRGFLSDAAPLSRLHAQLEATLQGRRHMEPGVARELLRRLGATRLPPAQAAVPAMAVEGRGVGLLRLLSVAQQALLSLLAHGYLPREIARAWALEADDIERRIDQLLGRLPSLWAQPQV